MWQKMIKEIASIQWWVYIHPNKGQDVSLLLAKHFDEFWNIKEQLIPEYTLWLCPDHHLLIDNDVLVWIKWSRFVSGLYKKEFGLCMASTTFIVLRVHDDNLIPEYLSILLNESLQSSYFKNRTLWTSIPSVPRSVIENYKIEVPLLELQKKYILLYKEFAHQKSLYEKVITKKHSLVHSLILSSS